MFEALTSAFLLLNYFAIILYILEGFATFGIVLIVCTILITLINYFLMRHSVMKLRKMAEIK
jgi:cation-transporting ATPase 13A2